MPALGTINSQTNVNSAADGATSDFDNSLNANDNIHVSRTFVGGGRGIFVQMGPGGQAVTGNGVEVSMGSGSSGHGLRAILAAGASGDGLHIEDSGSGPAIFANKIGGAGSLIDAQIGGTTVLMVDASGSIVAQPPGPETVDVLTNTGALNAGSSATGADVAGNVTINSDALAAGATSGDLQFTVSATGGGGTGGVTIGAFTGGVITAPAGEVSIQAEATAIAVGTISATVTTIGDTGAGACAIITHAEVTGSPGDACVVLNAARTTGGGGAAATAVGAFAIGVNAEAFSTIAPATPDLQTTLVALDAAIGGGGGTTLQAAYVNGNTIAVTTAEGSVAISNIADTTDALTISRTFGGAGQGVAVSMGATTTGDGVAITMVTGAAGDALILDDGTQTTRLNLADLLMSQSFTIKVDDATSGASTTGLALTSGAGFDAAAPTGGGAININGSGGGAASGAALGGAGGQVALSAGTGGTSATGQGGAGGSANLVGGPGAQIQAGGTFAGSGGTAQVRAGTGGASTAALAAAAGGLTQLLGGIGGANTGGTGTAGVGGATRVTGGDAGADNGGTGANGGAVEIAGGVPSGAGVQGTITFDALGSSAPIPFNETGDVDLSGSFTATSIVGALNELVAAGGGTLQTAYAAGNTIAVTTANGSVTMSNATDATDVLTLSRTFAGAGDVLDITKGASATGNAVRISQGGNTTGAGLLVTGGASSQVVVDVACNGFAPTAGVRVTTGGGIGVLINEQGVGSALETQKAGSTVLLVGAGLTATARGGADITLDAQTAGDDIIITGHALDIDASEGMTIDAGLGISLDALRSSNFSIGTNTSSAGGDMTITAGGTSNSGSKGGDVSITAGFGLDAGPGGDVTVTAGLGGASSTGGGDVNIVAGQGGGGTSPGGNVSIQSATGSTNGTISIGTSACSAITLGGGSCDITMGATGVLTIGTGAAEIHFGNSAATVGFFGAAAVSQSSAYTRNATVVEDRTLLASASATATNNNNVLAALIADLQAIGILG